MEDACFAVSDCRLYSMLYKAATLLAVFPIIVFVLDQEHLFDNHLGESATLAGFLSMSKVISVAQVHLSSSMRTYLCCLADPLQYSMQRGEEMV